MANFVSRKSLLLFLSLFYNITSSFYQRQCLPILSIHILLLSLFQKVREKDYCRCVPTHDILCFEKLNATKHKS